MRWCWVNFQCRGVLLILIIVGQGPTALTVGTGGSCLDIFVSPAKQKRDICIAFPASSLSSSTAA